MKIITPFLTAIVTVDEYKAGEGKDYNKLYIVDEDYNYFLRVKLAAGGEFIHPVNELPKPKVKSEPKIQEKVNFLPGGKVPQPFLNQIASFFRSVMDINFGGSNAKVGDQSEAMAHILWDTKLQKYEIGIPKQKVSKGSVDYSFDYLTPEKIIVVDIHSHNTMNSYFSGTDDGDDRKGCWNSGVIGNLHKEVPTASWRFTHFGIFKPLTIEDIFEVVGDINSKTAFPIEWLKRVEGRYTAPVFHTGSTTGGAGARGSWWPARTANQSNPSNRPHSGQGRLPLDPNAFDAYDRHLMELYGTSAFDDFDDDEEFAARTFHRLPAASRTPIAKAIQETRSSSSFQQFYPSMIGNRVLREKVEDTLLQIRTDMAWDSEYGVALYRPIMDQVRKIILRSMDPSVPQATGLFVLARDLVGNLGGSDTPDEIFDTEIPVEVTESIAESMAQVACWEGLECMIDSAVEQINERFVEGAEISLLLTKMEHQVQQYIDTDDDVVEKFCDELIVVINGFVGKKKDYGQKIAIELLRAISKGGYTEGDLNKEDLRTAAWAVSDILEIEADAGNINVPTDVISYLEKI